MPMVETENDRVVSPESQADRISDNNVNTSSEAGASYPAIALVTVPTLNVRTGPGPNFSIRSAVGENTALPVLEEKNDWYRVLLPGDVEGWVAEWHTQLKSPDVNSNRKAVVDTPVLHIRSGPSTGYQILTQASQGQEFPVINSVPGWVNILLTEDTSAWLSAGYVKEGQSSSEGDSDTTATTPSTLTGRTIVIDAGHGGSDPGAVGLGGLTEKFVNLDTSLRLVKLLEDAGAKVVLSRSNDTFIPLTQRVSTAHNVNADIFVSMHANAHNNRTIGGTETYYNGAYRPADSRRLAAAVQGELVSALKLRDIGVKTANFHVIRATQTPSILVELAFLSNAQEEALLSQPDFRQRSANAIYKGILNYFN